ncbi:acyl-CoA carboxylase subunit beta [Pararhodobacter sp.]|uniref:acyl-CoA carboxylase subunit beta n=1 Tax=Pararhodobacter sp. TaxID=2127056 RepID=UPI002FDC8E46
MPRFHSRLESTTPGFGANQADMSRLLDELSTLHQRAATLSEKRRSRFEERGQLSPRARLGHLLDPGMPWLEIYSLANYLVHDENPETSVPGASAIAGIGYVSGVRMMIFVTDSGINAGASTPRTGQKMRNCLDLALRHKLPFIHLVESAGANLRTYEVEGWANGGGMFRRLANLSAAGIPTLAVLHGPSTAGGAYYPGLSDYVIAVKGRGAASLGGAALVKAATGEEADPEALAGAQMHATISGLVEYLAENDADAIAIARSIVARLDWNRRCTAPVLPAYARPVHDPAELTGIVAVDYRKPYDVREVVARITDGSEFDDFKPGYGASVVCLQAAIMGHACAIIGNNGPIDTQGAAKAAQFIQLCDQSDTPLIFLHNVTGYMVGTRHEQAGMVKHGSKMIQAVANVTVPKISMYIGASFGAGNYGMAGYAYEPDFLFSWPNARSGVMGGEQAAITLEQVARASAARKGAGVDEAALAEQRAGLIAHFDRQSNAFYTSGRLLDMGVIDPRDSRRVLGFCLQTCREARNRILRPNSFGVARM